MNTELRGRRFDIIAEIQRELHNMPGTLREETFRPHSRIASSTEGAVSLCKGTILKPIVVFFVRLVSNKVSEERTYEVSIVGSRGQGEAATAVVCVCACVQFPLSVPPFAQPPSAEAVCESAARLLFMNVKWAKNVPAFTALNMHDQLLLLEASWRELFVLGAAQFLPPLDLGAVVASCGALHVDRRRLPLLHEVKLFQDTLDEFRHVHVDHHEFACLRAIALFKTVGLTIKQCKHDLRASRVSGAPQKCYFAIYNGLYGAKLKPVQLKQIPLLIPYPLSPEAVAAHILISWRLSNLPLILYFEVPRCPDIRFTFDPLFLVEYVGKLGSSVMAPTPSSLYNTDSRLSIPWVKAGSCCQRATLSPSSKIVHQSWRCFQGPMHSSSIHRASTINSPQNTAVRFATLLMLEDLEIPFPTLIVSLLHSRCASPTRTELPRFLTSMTTALAHRPVGPWAGIEIFPATPEPRNPLSATWGRDGLRNSRRTQAAIVPSRSQKHLAFAGPKGRVDPGTRAAMSMMFIPRQLVSLLYTSGHAEGGVSWSVLAHAFKSLTSSARRKGQFHQSRLSFNHSSQEAEDVSAALDRSGKRHVVVSQLQRRYEALGSKSFGEVQGAGGGSEGAVVAVVDSSDNGGGDGGSGSSSSSSSSKMLHDVQAVTALQDHTQLTLNKYISTAYPAQPFRFGKLLLLLPSLRTVSCHTIEELFFRRTIGHIPIQRIICDMYKTSDL
ncbi:hypothetical protein PR048_006005 [Dryococelus australis]|uniref:NR LBD domain-containing protein n=1 Tax=Dryococelus australis TaxID=614101 RepID=A0ABQ9I9T4_9NEOP|nr:hypothetical protein PR048_006005 [Dryococelus australis]